ncbi:hypothetical protein [Velocimicrobium porci]|nr:hypothetical protein [Velocimicrobium porci]
MRKKRLVVRKAVEKSNSILSVRSGKTSRKIEDAIPIINQK